jgi:hypothetical protein
MLTYDELVELAGLCSHNSRIATSREVATELRRMAKEYQPKPPSSARSPKSVTNFRCGTGRKSGPAPAIQIATRIVTTTRTLAASISVSATS